MPSEVNRDVVRAMLDAGVPVVEVLPSEEYDSIHLPGAINIPLRTLDRDSTADLEKDQPIVVYCNDCQ